MKTRKLTGLPYIKKFEISGKYYVYDVNWNSFFQVEEPIFHSLKDCDGEDDDTVSFVGRFSPGILKKAKKHIDEMRAKGYFSTQKPQVTYYHTLAKAQFWQFVKDMSQKKLYKITLVVTEACNMRCKYCAYSGRYQYHRKHSDKHMTLETMRKAVDFYFDHSTDLDEKNISFYGGEPLLNFGLIKECVIYTQKKYAVDANYNMTINGTLLTDERIRFFAENNFSLLISLDGPAQVHDRYRVFKNGKGSYDSLAKKLDKLKSMYPGYYEKKVRFNMVLAPPIDFKILDDFLIDLDVKPTRLSISRVDPNFTTFFNRFTTDEMRSYVKTVNNIIDDFNRRLSSGESPGKLQTHMFKTKYLSIHKRGNEKLLGKFPSHGQCILGSRGLFVNTNGSFNFCSQVDDTIRLGDLENGYDFDRIKKIYEDLEDLFSGGCYGCWALRLCSKCIKFFIEDGEVREDLLKAYCKQKKRAILKDICNYISIREKNEHAFEYLNDVNVY